MTIHAGQKLFSLSRIVRCSPPLLVATRTDRARRGSRRLAHRPPAACPRALRHQLCASGVEPGRPPGALQRWRRHVDVRRRSCVLLGPAPAPRSSLEIPTPRRSARGSGGRRQKTRGASELSVVRASCCWPCPFLETTSTLSYPSHMNCSTPAGRRAVGGGRRSPVKRDHRPSRGPLRIQTDVEGSDRSIRRSGSDQRV